MPKKLSHALDPKTERAIGAFVQRRLQHLKAMRNVAPVARAAAGAGDVGAMHRAMLLARLACTR